MTGASPTDFERATLDRIRDDFEAKGYRFVIEPTTKDLPEFLQPYRPDAVAYGKNNFDNVVIEIKWPHSRQIKIPLDQLDQKVVSDSGWRYLLVYAGQDPSEMIALSRPKKSQVDEAINEVRGLEGLGYLRAAMLEGWSLLEALARRIYPDDIRVSLKPLSPLAVIERLAMDGQINDEDARRLRAMSSIRNSVAHGDLNVTVSKDDVHFLLDKAEIVNTNVTM